MAAPHKAAPGPWYRPTGARNTYSSTASYQPPLPPHIAGRVTTAAKCPVCHGSDRCSFCEVADGRVVACCGPHRAGQLAHDDGSWAQASRRYVYWMGSDGRFHTVSDIRSGSCVVSDDTRSLLRLLVLGRESAA